MLKALKPDIKIIQKGFFLAKINYSKIWRHLFLITILILFIAALSAFIPFMLKLLVDSISQKPENTHIKYLLFLAIAYAVMWTLNQASDWIKGGFTSYFLSSIDASIYQFFLEKIIRAQHNQQQLIDHGKFISEVQRAGNSIGQVVYIIVWTMLPMIIQLLMAFIIIAQTISIGFSTFLVFFLILALFLALKLMQKSMHIHPMIYSAKNMIMSHGVERLNLLYEIKTNILENKERAILNNISKEFVNKIFSANLRSAKLMALQIVFIGVLLITSNVYLIFQITQKYLTAGDFVMITGYIIQLSLPIIMLSQLLIQLKGNIIAISDVFKYIDIPEDKSLNKNYKANFQQSIYHIDQLKIAHLKKSINVIIKKGYWYTIIGESGSGKSSLIHSLLALNDVNYSKFEFGGIDIQELSHQNILSYIAVVNQQSVTYKVSLTESLSFASDISITKEMMRNTLNKLQLNHLVNYLESDSIEWIKNLSGGELQRLSICRAYLRQTPIIILDEPTSALDERNTENVLQFLANSFSTVIMVTHNSSALKFSNYVMDMDDPSPEFVQYNC